MSLLAKTPPLYRETSFSSVTGGFDESLPRDSKITGDEVVVKGAGRFNARVITKKITWDKSEGCTVNALSWTPLT